MEQSRLGMQITVLMSFKRNGELFDHLSIEGSVGDGTLVISHRRGANAQTICVFAVHGGAGSTVAGQALTMTLVDDREQRP